MTESSRRGEKTGARLHLGCFDQALSGWVNTDITPHIFVARTPGLARLLFRLGLISERRYRQHREGAFRHARYLDVRRRFPFAGETFDCIYSSHMLEHLSPRDASRMLCECRRVLKPGGVLRIAVPDLDRIIAAYRPEEAARTLELLFEAAHGGGKNAHHWQYNAHLLEAALRQAGFRRVERCAYRQGACPGVENIDSRPDSLFMEAYK